MRDKAKYWLFSVLLASISIAIGAAILNHVFVELTFAEAIAVIVYPLAVGYIISSHSTYRVLARLGEVQADLAQASERLTLMGGQHVICHGTKYHVPNREHFWDDLLEKAHHEFILVGNTNKSWIKRDPEQSQRLGAAIVRMTSNSGRVTIVSGNQAERVRDTENFFREHVYGQLTNLSKRKRERLRRALKANLRYAVASRVNYSAVVSDDRMLIIPRLNSEDFTAEAMVLELRRDIHTTQFMHYHGDIDRIIREAGLHEIESVI